MAIAKRSGDNWFLGVMNDTIRKEVLINLSFLTAGDYTAEVWADTKNSDKVPTELKKSVQTIKTGQMLKVAMAKNGGYVAVIRRK
jgi:alpha-glucosidase